jgi:hypothetical protein
VRLAEREHSDVLLLDNIIPRRHLPAPVAQETCPITYILLTNVLPPKYRSPHTPATRSATCSADAVRA